MYKRIGLLATALAIVVMLNAGPAKAEPLAPSVAAGGVENALDPAKRAPLAITPAVTNPQTAVACQMCFTCGGDWPIFAGEPRLFQSGGVGSFERGGSCSGNLHTSNDTDPFLCCR
jgi:hypothetical protein